MKKLFRKIALGLAGLFLASVVCAQPYTGYNANGTTVGGGLNGTLGVLLALNGPTSLVPVASGVNCGTTITVVAGTVFQLVTTGTTSTVCTLTFPFAAPHGYFCQYSDITTPTGISKQASFTTTSCTSAAATTGATDVVLVEVIAF